MSPFKTYWVASCATIVLLLALDEFAGWLFEWHRPTWLNIAAGLAYGVFGTAVGTHWRGRAEARDEASAEKADAS